MIYFDNSATTFPKPRIVREAVAAAVRYSANPGRSGHELSIRASEEIFRTRKAAASFFNVPSEDKVIFTLNCTAAMNIVVKGVLKSGDHVVVSDMEHNAVMRPLERMTKNGVTYTAAKVFPQDNDKTVDSFRKCINAKTRMIICTQASNVWGVRLPVERLAALAHEYGLLIAVDAAQSAGVVPIDVTDSRIDFLCVAGHKGLYGPMGTGMLIIGGDTVPQSIIEGGTGSNSSFFEQPSELPDRLESGTPNVPGIAGLRAGMEFVSQYGQERAFRHEFMLIKRLYRQLSSTNGVELYMPEPDEYHFVPILSFNIAGLDSESTAKYLSTNGIAVRAGLHCSPAAHRAAGTEKNGAVRISPSVFNTVHDIDSTVMSVRNIIRSVRYQKG